MTLPATFSDSVFAPCAARGVSSWHLLRLPPVPPVEPRPVQVVRAVDVPTSAAEVPAQIRPPRTRGWQASIPQLCSEAFPKLVATLAEAGQGALAGQTSGGQRTAWEHLGFWSQGQILLVAGPLPRPAPLPTRPLQHRVECIQLCLYFPLLEVSSFPHHGFPSTPWRGRGP